MPSVTAVVIVAVTFVVFFGEGIFHYNIGRGTLSLYPWTIAMPRGRELLDFVGVLLLFSTLNGVLSGLALTGQQPK